MCTKRWSRVAVFTALLFSALWTWQPSGSLAAATIPEDIDEPTVSAPVANPVDDFTLLLIKRMQKALITIGIFAGPVNGIADDETTRAVRQYQRSTRQTPTGIIDEKLVIHLETAVSVSNLLDTLSLARQAHTKEAREALLANPATKDLITEGLSDEVANPVRDPSACFTEPTVRCLLDEAVESAKAITRDDMRNWAFGDILVAQARAGLSADARDTMRRISDPRMIMVALGEIAEARARAGQAESAIAAVDVIPDMATRSEAYANIANTLASAGLKQGVISAVAKLRDQVDLDNIDAKAVAQLTRASAALFQCGNTEDGVALLEEAESAANSIADINNRDTALRHVADTNAGIGRIDQAITILNTIESPSERMPVLMSTARAQAQKGDPDAALELASSIEAVRYRALVLASIAEGQAQIGNLQAAQITLENATADMEAIDLPYAKDFATSRIAMAYARIASDMDQPSPAMFDQATSLTDGIKDNKTRAYAAWNISFYNQQSGVGEAAETRAHAYAVTNEIPSPGGQAWLLAELAEKRTTDGHGEWAWEMFDRALGITESIKNAWGRARALSRLSQTLVRLVETKAVHGPITSNEATSKEATSSE